MSTYTGTVTPGGPTDVRELPGLVIRKASVGPQDNNAYLLTCTATGCQLLVDAADDAPRLTALVAAGSGELDVIVTTHQHWDHHRALAAMVEHTGARTAAGAADAAELPVPVGQLLEHGDEVDRRTRRAEQGRHGVGLRLDRTHLGQAGQLVVDVEELADPSGRGRVQHDGVVLPAGALLARAAGRLPKDRRGRFLTYAGAARADG